METWDQGFSYDVFQTFFFREFFREFREFWPLGLKIREFLNQVSFGLFFGKIQWKIREFFQIFLKPFSDDWRTAQIDLYQHIFLPQIDTEPGKCIEESWKHTFFSPAAGRIQMSKSKV